MGMIRTESMINSSDEQILFVGSTVFCAGFNARLEGLCGRSWAKVHAGIEAAARAVGLGTRTGVRVVGRADLTELDVRVDNVILRVVSLYLVRVAGASGAGTARTSSSSLGLGERGVEPEHVFGMVVPE